MARNEFKWHHAAPQHLRSRGELNTFVKKLISLPYVDHTCTYTVLNTEKEELVSATIL